MSLRSFLILFLLHSWWGIAAAQTRASESPPSRASQAELSLQFGRDAYRATRLLGDFGLGPDWQLNVSFSGEKSSGTTLSTGMQLGANVLLGESARFKFGARFLKEPNEVTGVGGYLGVGWVVSDLWSATLMTELTLDLASTQYTQSKRKVLARILGQSVPMSWFTIGVSQELSTEFQLLASVTSYSYGGSTAETLSEAISNRPNISLGLLQLVDGLPKSDLSLGASWQLENWTLAPYFSSTTLAYDEVVTGWSLQAERRIGTAWSVLLDLVFSSGASTSTLFGVGASFRW